MRPLRNSLPLRLQDRAVTGEAGALHVALARRRVAALEISHDVTFKGVSSTGNPGGGNAGATSGAAPGVLWLDLDSVEQRWLLAGTADATVAVYDTQAAHSTEAGSTSSSPQYAALEPAAVVDRRRPSAHKFLVTCVAWYPVDTGLFVSGSFDEEVKLWDTNTLQMACRWALGAKVYSAAMSPVATAHSLIAVGSHDPTVKLCDPVSGAFSHTLTGHRDKVWSVCWSLQSEFELLSGDASGQMRLWDIRRAGCRLVFDQHCTQRKLPAPAKAAAAHLQQSSGGAQRGKKRQQQHHQQQQQRQEACAGSNGDARQVYAHEGAITCIHATANALNYVTGGTDSRVRLWDSVQHHHQLVHYPATHNRAVRARQLCTSDDGRVLFHPSGSIVQVFDFLSGQLIKELKEGHYESINACVYNPVLQQLYTGGNDGSIVAWDASAADARQDTGDDDNDGFSFGVRTAGPAVGHEDRDAWSDGSL